MNPFPPRTGPGSLRRTALVIGGGAEAAAAALELQGPFEVIVLETAARPPNPDPGAGPRGIDGRDALRLDQSLRELGVDLDREFAELAQQLPPSTRHQRRWLPDTWRLFELCRRMGLDPRVTPKMPAPGILLEQALRRGARRIRRARVERLTVDGGFATGAILVQGARPVLLPASLLVLAAGGQDTPAILHRSGIECGPARCAQPALRLWIRRDGADREIPTPFLVERQGFALGPCLEPRRLGLRLLPADSPPSRDLARRQEAVELASDILHRLGARREELRLEEAAAGQPGGALPLNAREARSLHPAVLPENLYVADATLLPGGISEAHLLTLLALARRVARAACGQYRRLRAS